MTEARTAFRRPEILSPAGNPEKLAAALRFGADAVYLAGESFGMRSAADNFTVGELYDAAHTVHAAHKKLYLTLNTLPHGGEYPRLYEFLREVADAGIDAYIVADLGVMATLREVIPNAETHVSTQASIVSPAAAKAYAALGASRLVLARELTLDEIRAIRDSLAPNVELEAFVHGSMCVSYSGRCMLSNMLTGRDANRGACAQPCRWNYTLYEEKRPETPIPVEQSEIGTFIMSSKDMCMIDHVGKLADAGVDSFKIEGRIKSAYYAAVVTNAYKMAVDACADFVANGGNARDFRPAPELYTELCSVSHREYATGFFFDRPTENPQLVTEGGYVREKAYLAVAEDPNGWHGEGELFTFRQRNKLCLGDEAELLTPGKTGQRFTITEMYDMNGEAISSAPHPSMYLKIKVPFTVREGDILRGAGA